MSDERLEMRVTGKINIQFKVVGKRSIKSLFGEKFIISCYSDQINASFRLRVDEPSYNMLESGKQYWLDDQPVLQQYDRENRPVGDPLVRPSNLFFG